MRRILVATLLSSLALTAGAATPKSADANGASPASVVASTGVTAAQLRYSTNIDIPAEALSSLSNPAELVLRVNLDETGTPTHMQVVRSINPTVDARVMKAVRTFRWTPAVLDNRTIPVDVNLVVDVQH